MENEQEVATLGATLGGEDAEAPQYSSMNVKQLKDELRKKGLKVSGKKAELIARLSEADGEGGSNGDEGHGGTAETDSSSDSYPSMKVAQLKAELRKRNLKVSGNKAELIKRLREPKPEDAAGFRKGSGKDKEKVVKWGDSDARKYLHDILVKGEDMDGNKVSLQSGPGQYPKDILKLVQDLEEFQVSNFAQLGPFGTRLASLRKIVIDKKYFAVKDRIALQNSLAENPIPKLDHRGARPFVDFALPLLRKDMDKGLHLTMRPMLLHRKRPEYEEHELEVFRKHIHQEVYTRKACNQYKWKGSRHGDDLGVEFKQGLIEVDEDDSYCDEEPDEGFIGDEEGGGEGGGVEETEEDMAMGIINAGWKDHVGSIQETAE